MSHGKACWSMTIDVIANFITIKFEKWNKKETNTVENGVNNNMNSNGDKNRNSTVTVKHANMTQRYDIIHSINRYYYRGNNSKQYNIRYSRNAL
jgi:hypothetical protein